MLVLAGLGWSAWQQNKHLNLSETAGGQSPYLKYATGIAQQGITSFVGDRNRMPIVPAITAIAYNKDPQIFFERAKYLAMFTSLIALAMVGGLAYKCLPILPASALTLTAAICMFLNKASFVQAELLYYSLSFATWLLLCKLLTKPTLGVAALTGVSLGVSFLTKGSALPLLIAYSAILLSYITLVLISRWCKQKTPSGHSKKPSPAIHLACLGIVVSLFLLIVGPYLHTNKERYNQYFYNVNSTFFFWCDNWDQAKSFADTYHIDQQYPQAPDSEIPSANHYWQTHSTTQMIQRLGYGLRTLTDLGWHSTYAKYFLALAVFTIGLALINRKHAGELIRIHQLAVTYSLLTISSYLFAYAWYVPVAYGDRFLLSLLIPAMFSCWWFIVSLDSRRRCTNSTSTRIPATNVFAGVIILALMMEGGLSASVYARTPTSNFIRFYYNESKEAQLAGDIEEAIRGYQGIIKLDPSFVAAHRELGMLALMRGAFEQAIQHLSKASALKPNDADLHNSLGSAIIQSGNAAKALSSFKEAVRLDPNHATAWYNLAGTYLQLGDTKQAKLIADKLSVLSPKKASQLRRLIEINNQSSAQ